MRSSAPIRGSIVPMVRIDGGSFLMGSEGYYPEEMPVHLAHVEPFEIAAVAVSNADFAEFVAATGYVTVAERPLDPALFSGQIASTEPGSMVFMPCEGPVDLDDWRQWWRWLPGANWRAPRGPGSQWVGEDHPVVQVAFEDALAFADWAGARLPTEAEWEFAARGGLVGATFAWGEAPNDGTRANTWQGDFPYRHTRTDPTRALTAPVDDFLPNGFGLYQMTGNTWEWTASRWTPRHDAGGVGAEATGVEAEAEAAGCGCHGVAAPLSSRVRVLKGGSHLCAPEYCLRYRPAARSPQTEDSAATHIGLRIARDV